MKSHGFTLIELTVVIALMGLLFFVAVPRFEAAFDVGPLDKTINAITARVLALKESAIRTQQPQYLLVDFAAKKIANSSTPLDPNGLAPETKGGFPIPEGASITDVEHPDGTSESTGVVQLRVSAQGYVQHAALHLQDKDGRNVTLFLEPFLGRTRLVEGNVGMEKE